MLCWCRAVPVAVRGAEHTKKGVRIACVGVACEIGRVAGRDNRTNNQKHVGFCTYLCEPDIMAWRNRSAAPLRGPPWP